MEKENSKNAVPEIKARIMAECIINGQHITHYLLSDNKILEIVTPVKKPS